MTEGVCHCGHSRRTHRGGERGCRFKAEDDWYRSCLCKAFDDSVLPVEGERLEFGKHRQPAPDAETAPMWPPLRAPR